MTFLVPAAVKCPIERTGQIKRSTWRQRIADGDIGADCRCRRHVIRKTQVAQPMVVHALDAEAQATLNGAADDKIAENVFAAQAEEAHRNLLPVADAFSQSGAFRWPFRKPSSFE